jgi:hypothetical protein
MKDDALRHKYKAILASILPPEMLTGEGLLKTPSGVGEAIRIIPPAAKTFFQVLGLASYERGASFYDGGLHLKTLRHLLNKRRAELNPAEAETLDMFIAANLPANGTADTISVRGAKHRGVLAHEAFHDIQGFLYDFHPEIMDRLMVSLTSRKSEIECWFKDSVNYRFTREDNYKFRHLFPDTEDDSPYGPGLELEAREALVKRKRNREIRPADASIAFYRLLIDTTKQLGTNEAIPVLLGAASEGNKEAAKIVSEVFGESGLNGNFMSTLPRL